MIVGQPEVPEAEPVCHAERGLWGNERGLASDKLLVCCLQLEGGPRREQEGRAVEGHVRPRCLRLTVAALEEQTPLRNSGLDCSGDAPLARADPREETGVDPDVGEGLLDCVGHQLTRAWFLCHYAGTLPCNWKRCLLRPAQHVGSGRDSYQRTTRTQCRGGQQDSQFRVWAPSGVRKPTHRVRSDSD